MSSYFGFPSGPTYSAPQTAYQATASATVPASFVPTPPAPSAFTAAAASVVAAPYTYTAAPTAYAAAAAAAYQQVPHQQHQQRPPPAAPQTGSGQVFRPSWTTAPSYQSFTANTATPAVAKVAPPPPPPPPPPPQLPLPKLAYQPTGTGGGKLFHSGYGSGGQNWFGQHAPGASGFRQPHHQQQFGQQPQQHQQQQRRPPYQHSGGPRRPFYNQHYQQHQQSSQHNPVSLQYCEVCKISCAGPQTFKEHLQGQKHKKREAAAKRQQEDSPKPNQKQLRCELCDVTCTGADAYASHIRGAKHLKTAKLHTRLGKSLPSTDPILVQARQPAEQAGINQPQAQKQQHQPQQQQPAQPPPALKRVVGAPRFGFVPGSALKSVGSEEAADPSPTEAGPQAADSAGSSAAASTAATSSSTVEQHVELSVLQEREYVAPVGSEYIDEMPNEQGKAMQFHCKLCDCKFNDPHAKEMHLKGRRHRLQYKRKVDPSLEVDVKPSMRARRLEDAQPGWARASAMMPMQQDWQQQFPPGGARYRQSAQLMMLANQHRVGYRHETSDDRHLAAKLANLAQSEPDCQALHALAARCEQALRQVSEQLTADDGQQQLNGAMRVGSLAKDVTLFWDRQSELVLLCSAWPSQALISRLVELLPAKLCPPDSGQTLLTVQPDPGDASTAILVACSDGSLRCRISLTSVAVRDWESAESQDQCDQLLDKEKCLEALANLRRAKWFQAKASQLFSFVPVVKILRDLRRRIPAWAALSEWAAELVVEKSISSDCVPLSPSEALRRVLECLAAGLLLPGGPGLLDPCEKIPTDAAADLSAQEREDLTAAAQRAVRLIAFRQLYRLLDMPRLMPSSSDRRAGGAGVKRSAAARSGSSADGSGVSASKLARSNNEDLDDDDNADDDEEEEEEEIDEEPTAGEAEDAEDADGDYADVNAGPA